MKKLKYFSKKNLGLTEGLNFLLKKTKSDVILDWMEMIFGMQTN